LWKVDGQCGDGSSKEEKGGQRGDHVTMDDRQQPAMTDNNVSVQHNNQIVHGGRRGRKTVGNNTVNALLLCWHLFVKRREGANERQYNNGLLQQQQQTT
jgi:hypothetical protein